MKYEVILFDADETLYDFKKSEREAFKNTMLNFKIKYDESYHLKTYQEINTALWMEFEQGLITQEKLKVERFKRLSDRLDLSFDENIFAKSYMEHLANASFLYDDSIDLIESLNKFYKLAIVTNGLTFVQDKRIRKSIISKYFDTIVISEEVLISKPNPKIFEHTLKNINHTDKSKVLIVGDSLTSDIQCGINFGIDTCWYNPNNIINETSIKPDYEISNFNELKSLLLNL
ncbi:YjjG family noncanonical pyrimidine nucleotidase [Clostridium chauvoei]|uniref:YjjG family noncanonical pyrimidine nucleotidase n=2 Tax=Clostridium chauvoei TaxID=46867 RepID=A0ABD4RKA6_9CLOT|nr:YjjG family noncanonical pyrimidine nucleotidase [Clostridium chauvoei]ATD56098.1 noncanonical pyrimidine nucleotidase, YjjG family [Clostridium chauvoei]ATD58588.1 noncanonical pyrimidine nucleotidase, YjjG family [Clostridium chauvoei]MBX7281723.1 YjjG family noncanonical pyrimidine nucleotidase [Clostridium chauvoei]MBX7284243.1 YjjG family noncanonical pyrimidine nucleotidase [Clostridium chauvoei]MBX7286129.1 YjjG family noncanonical pyrimidine nucleotidase [Clostridium chauvoei]